MSWFGCLDDFWIEWISVRCRMERWLSEPGKGIGIEGWVRQRY